MNKPMNNTYPDFLWPTEIKRLEDFRTRVVKLKERYSKEVWTWFFTVLSKKTGVNNVKLSHFYNRIRGFNWKDLQAIEEAITKMEKNKNFLN